MPQSLRDSIANLLLPKSSKRLIAQRGRASSTFGEQSSALASNPDLSAISARFRIREKLGQGGMGIVYRAYDAELGHDVALKSLTQLQPEAIYYLKREFRSLADIRHPNLVH